MIAALYAAIPLITYYWLLRLLIGTRAATKATSLTFGVLAIFMICFLGGFAVSFFYEPESWLKSLVEDLNAPLDFISHAFPDGTAPVKFLAAPYYFVVAAVWTMVVVVFKHFTIAFAVFYAVGIYIVDQWVCVLTADSRLRAQLFPDRGASSSALQDPEQAQYRRILGIKSR